MGILVDLKDLPPPPATPLPSGSTRTRRHHRTNLLSGWHKGEGRGQISAATWRCFLMVMSSQTCLQPPRRTAGGRRVPVVRQVRLAGQQHLTLEHTEATSQVLNSRWCSCTHTRTRGGCGIRPQRSPEGPPGALRMQTGSYWLTQLSNTGRLKSYFHFRNRIIFQMFVAFLLIRLLVAVKGTAG